MKNFESLLIDFLGNVSSLMITLCGLAFLFVLFVITKVWLKIKNTSYKETVFIDNFGVFLTLFILSVLLIKKENVFYVFGYTATFLSFEFLFRGILEAGKPKEDNFNNEKAIRLVKEMDKQIKESAVKPQDVTVSRETLEKIQTSNKRLRSEIDFSHVKKVIEKLKDCSLNVDEKKRINDFCVKMKKAECGNISDTDRGEINDDLSMILKLMSKYQV